MKIPLKAGLKIFGLLIICILALEFFLRIFTSLNPWPGFYLSGQWLKRDLRVGLIHEPNFQGKIKSKEYEVNLVTNSEGFRSIQEYIVGNNENKVIAVLGDSFVEAAQVEEKNTFVKLLADKLKDEKVRQVQNYGVGSTGLVHYLQIYRYFTRNHHPQVVIISVFSENDFEDSSKYEDIVPPKYELDKGGGYY